MNNDLISRSELKKALKSNCDTLCPDKNTNWCEHCCPLNDFEDLIDNAPTVDEIPQGDWVRKEDIIHYIATQYSEHNELVPVWLNIGDLKGGVE